MKRTKIIATIGPACRQVNVLKKMIGAGLNAARFNFSHGTYAQFDELIGNLKIAGDSLKKSITLIQDIQGPKIRLGKIPAPGLELKKHEKIILGTKSGQQNNSLKILPIQYKNLPKEVRPGQILLIDDGLIEIKVLTTDKKSTIECLVTEPGLASSYKGINIPGGNINAPALTKKDFKDIIFGKKYNFDYIALSFVKSGADIKKLRHFLKKHNYPAKIIAKIERREAIENLENIAKNADAIMVARGDLGLEIPAEKVPIMQKKIVELGLKYGKPTIIATQMLQSMIKNPRASRAEISDIATAIFDHADCLMLSNETSVGQHPVKTIQTLSRVARSVEQEMMKHQDLMPKPQTKIDLPLPEASCASACEMAKSIKAKYLVILTKYGLTARLISRHRPSTPIITITTDKKIANYLNLFWGINKIYNIKTKNIFKLTDEKIINFLKPKINLKSSDEIVIVHIHKGKNLISSIKIE